MITKIVLGCTCQTCSHLLNSVLAEATRRTVFEKLAALGGGRKGKGYYGTLLARFVCKWRQQILLLLYGFLLTRTLWQFVSFTLSTHEKCTSAMRKKSIRRRCRVMPDVFWLILLLIPPTWLVLRPLQCVCCSGTAVVYLDHIASCCDCQQPRQQNFWMNTVLSCICVWFSCGSAHCTFELKLFSALD